MFHLGVERVMIVLAVILLASAAEKVLVAKLAVADTGLEALLFVCGRLSHRTINALAAAVDRNPARISRGRRVRLSDTGVGR